jgi:outer membrane receptor protein involved in Fe transport
MKFIIFIILLFKLSMVTAKASEKIYIRISYGDTLSTILFSLGSAPLYRQVGAVEIHEVVYKSIYKNPLEVGQSAPILKSSIRFHENLIKLDQNLYDIKERINTMEDYRRYVERRIVKIDDSGQDLTSNENAIVFSEPEPETQTNYLQQTSTKTTDTRPLFARANIGLGHRLINRKITQGSLDTQTKSNGQPYLTLNSSIEFNLLSIQPGIEIQPWVGSSEGLSTDYLFSINHFLSGYKLSPLLGIKHEKIGFISRDQSNRIVNASKNTILDLGLRFSLNSQLEFVLAYEVGLKTKFDNQNTNLKHNGFLINTNWFFQERWSLNLGYRQSKVKHGESLNLSASNITTALHFWF